MKFADPDQVVAEIAANVWRVQAKQRVSDWADHNRELSAKRSSIPGQWSTDRTPYLRGPMDAVDDIRIRAITIIKATQTGGTETLINALAYSVARRPTPGLWVYPNDRIASRVNKRRLLPALRSIPEVASQMSGVREDETKLEVSFRSMDMVFTGAGSEANIEGDPCGLAIIDELDRCEERQPDVREIVERRLDTFPDSKLICNGTPGLAEIGIDRAWRSSQQMMYFVPCTSCGQYYARDQFKRVKWPTHDDEHPLDVPVERVRRHAWYECPHCEHANRAADNHWQLFRGVWICPADGERVVSSGEILSAAGDDAALSRLDWDAVRWPTGETAEQLERVGVRIEDPVEPAGHVGFWIGGLYSALSPNPYGAVAAGFVEARGDPPPTWFQRSLGEAWQVRGDAVPVAEARKRCKPISAGGYRHGTYPSDAVVLTQAFDVQPDLVWHSVRWWGERGESGGLVHYQKIASVEDSQLVEIDVEALRAWPEFRGGGSMRCVATFIDHGHRSKEVIRAVRRLAAGGLANVIPVKGAGSTQMLEPWRWTQVDAPVDGRGRRMQGGGVPLLLINVDDWKGRVVARIRDREDEQRADLWTMPADTPEDYLEQVTAEHRVKKRERGRVVFAWQLRSGQKHNHALDLDVYQAAGADAKHIDRVTRVAIDQAKEQATKPKPRPTPNAGGSQLIERARRSPNILNRRR